MKLKLYAKDESADSCTIFFFSFPSYVDLAQINAKAVKTNSDAPF